MRTRLAFMLFTIILLTSCAHMNKPGMPSYRNQPPPAINSAAYSSRMPMNIGSRGEKVIIVNPQQHAWGAYDVNGSLVRGGIATSGSDWCPDLGRACHTRPGTYRIYSLGSESCKSSLFPRPHGGAPMPYCMFFHGGQALHGSLPGAVVDANVSHGCVRLTIPDAQWLRYNFANVGTRVVITPY